MLFSCRRGSVLVLLCNKLNLSVRLALGPSVRNSRIDAVLRRLNDGLVSQVYFGTHWRRRAGDREQARDRAEDGESVYLVPTKGYQRYFYSSMLPVDKFAFEFSEWNQSSCYCVFLLGFILCFSQLCYIDLMH